MRSHHVSPAVLEVQRGNLWNLAGGGKLFRQLIMFLTALGRAGASWRVGLSSPQTSIEIRKRDTNARCNRASAR
jgi:hypothetical protein